MRPLELTREAWYTENNLADYFDVSKDVLLNAGDAIINPNYDHTEVFSQEILIPHPERVCSYDETRLELDYTTHGKIKGDRYINTGENENGEVIVSRNSKTASAVCGRLGDGKSLLVFIVFASGDEHDAMKTPEISEPSRAHNIVDKNGNPIVRRYTSNVKGTVNDTFCADFIETVLHPALGYPKPGETYRGHQSVIVCDVVCRNASLRECD